MCYEIGCVCGELNFTLRKLHICCFIPFFQLKPNYCQVQQSVVQFGDNRTEQLGTIVIGIVSYGT